MKPDIYSLMDKAIQQGVIQKMGYIDVTILERIDKLDNKISEKIDELCNDVVAAKMERTELKTLMKNHLNHHEKLQSRLLYPTLVLAGGALVIWLGRFIYSTVIHLIK